MYISAKSDSMAFHYLKLMAPVVIKDILGNICGFLVIIVAIILLNTFKDMDVSLNDVRVVFRPKRDSLPYKVLLYGDDALVSHTYGTPDTP